MNQQIIQAIREFNRQYVLILGLLNTSLKNSSYSLLEARILFEIDTKENCVASEIATRLRIDRGYLSRIIKKLIELELVVRKNDPQDQRRGLLALTKKGTEELAKINKESDKNIYEMFCDFSIDELEMITETMFLIQKKTGSK